VYSRCQRRRLTMTKAQASKDSVGLKAMSRQNVLRGRRCLRCPFCAPSGRCLDTTIRSGRCGDWVYYLLRGKQFRHLWVKPRDPRTPSQLHWRSRLATASVQYSRALTDEQQNACIAAGARRRSRPRMGESGPLTGQQHWVGRQCARKAESSIQSAENARKGLQTKGILRPTWDLHRSTSVVPPWQHRRDTRQARPEWDKPKIPRSKPERKSNAQTPRAQNLLVAKVSGISSCVRWTRSGFRASGFGAGRSAFGGALGMRPRVHQRPRSQPLTETLLPLARHFLTSLFHDARGRHLETR
jgi:hypothetical protein